MTISVLSLFVAETKEAILSFGIEVAQVLGLPVSSWRDGDPTKSLYHFQAEAQAAREEKNVSFAKSGFLSTAEGDWATLHALEVYGITRGEATYATPTVTLTNGGGGVFSDLGNGGLVVKATSTGKTFRSMNDPGVLGPGDTLTWELIAEEAGAASSVAANEIDDFVTPGELATFGVVVTSSTAAAAQDQQSVEELRDQCGDSLGALSPDGPPDAYEYVCKNSDLTGNTEINRATTLGDDDTGEVAVYVASASGAVTAPSVAAAQAAVLIWATPVCIRPTVVSATPRTVNVSAQITGDRIPASFEDTITGALGALLESLPIGGAVYRSRLIAAIHAAIPQAVSVNLVAPAADVTLANNEVPVLGTVGVTEV
jgi:uncharacterized phage protein gp47/JayE